MPNSTYTLAKLVTHTRSFPDLATIVQNAAGGSSLEPALTLANDVMIEMIAQVFNWKFNRFTLPTFLTNSWQNDYALNVVNLGWLESGFLVDINNTAYPQPIWPLEVIKYVERTSGQYGRPGQACFLPNDQLAYAVWGAANTASQGGNNPQPNQVIGPLLGVNASPANPWLQVADTFGNFWVVTTFGTTGATTPFATNLNPVFPTPAAPNTVATTVTDGSVVWTAVNPKGQGIRLNPLPPQTGVVYQVNLIGQWRPFAFSNGPFTLLSQTIEPIPDDFAKYFRDGFIAMCYAHSQDKGLRGKFQDQFKMWKEALMAARVSGDREKNNNSFYPSQGIMDGSNYDSNWAGPAYPWPY